MAKKKSKSKKSKRRSQAARRAAAQRVQHSGSVKAAQATGRRSKSSAAKTVSFEEEYAYVYQDLKLVGIIAAAMVVILVVLSFVIT